MPPNDAISLYIPPSYYFLGLRVTDIAIVGLAIILALFVALIVYLIATGSGERQPPWQRRRRYQRYQHDNQHNEIGRG
jgi:hypothetical protein